MAQGIQGGGMRRSLFVLLGKVSLLAFVPSACALLVTVLLLSNSVAATPKQLGVEIVQDPESTSQAASERALREGWELQRQGTAESLQQAIEKYRQAFQLKQSIGDLQGQALTLYFIGLAYNLLSEKQQALDYYNQTLPLWRTVQNRYWEATTLDSIGGVYNFLGEKQQALDYYNQALLIWQATRNRTGEATTLTGIGRTYYDLGENQKALEYLNKALPLAQAVGNRFKEASTLYNIGLVYDAMSKHQQALDYYNQALPMWRAVRNRAGEAYTLTGIAKVYDAMGKHQQALDYYNQALSLRRAVGDRYGESYTLTGIGRVYDALGKKQQALDYFDDALVLARAVGDRSGEAATLYNIAFVKRSQGNLTEALTYIEASLKIIDSLRTKVASQELRATYLASVQDYYKFYIDLLMQLHKTNPTSGYDAQALFASERGKARSLLEILTEAHADIKQGVDPKLLEQERTIKEQLSDKEQLSVQILSGEHTSAQALAIQQEIEKLVSQYQEIQAQIRVKSPRYAALTQPQPLTLQEIQSTLLDDHTLLLEYSLGKERSYLWAVTKTSITSYELPKGADIEAAAKRFRDALTVPTQRNFPAKVASAATELGNMLLSSVAGQLGNKRLVIVSDGALQYVPFAAMRVPGKSGDSLVVEHEIINLPSASTLAVLRRELTGRKPAPKTVAVLADPVFTRDDERLNGVRQAGLLLTGQRAANSIPAELERAASDSDVTFSRLPGTRQEAEQILALVPASEEKQAFDFTANRTIATSPDLAQYRIVHFATHGILNSVNPELSGVVLSLVDEHGAPTNGFLRLHDIYNLNLPAELVVLSACQTGLGQDVKGEGLVGLTRGFMYAGAARVVMSLWSVDDRATAELMQIFYKKMLREGLKPVAALRAAQVEMSQHPQWSSPYYWAAFTIQGEWK
jgi:CHAT domain-containing protein